MPSYAIIHTLSFFTFSGKAFRYFQTKKKQFRELPCPFMKYTMTKRHMESPVACFHYKIKKVRPFIVIPVIPQGYFHAAEQFPRSFPTALPRPRGGGRHRASGAVPSTHGSGRMRGTRKNAATASERGGTRQTRPGKNCGKQNAREREGKNGNRSNEERIGLLRVKRGSTTPRRRKNEGPSCSDIPPPKAETMPCTTSAPQNSASGTTQKKRPFRRTSAERTLPTHDAEDAAKNARPVNSDTRLRRSCKGCSFTSQAGNLTSQSSESSYFNNWDSCIKIFY